MRNRTYAARTRFVLQIALLLTIGGPAFAQNTFGPIDLTGQWASVTQDGGGFDNNRPGQYVGFPMNDEARARADAWMASYQSLPERQCIMYTSFYMVKGPQGFQMTSELHPISGKVIAWKMSGAIDRTPRTIWMDGRAHPSEYDLHTSSGFSTGEWRGDMLIVHTTHLTDGMLALTGEPTSSQATIDEFITRHGTNLTITMVLHDPVYLEEPYISSKMFVLDAATRMLPEPCEPVVEISRPVGQVPNYLPGANPALREAADIYRVPQEANRGGAATLYPEYRKRLKELLTSSEAAK